MATMATIKPDTRFLGLPKNKTGLFAADTLHEVKPSRNHLITVPTLCPQFRNNGSTSFLFASSEQNQHQLQQYQLSKQEIQQYYPLEGSTGTTVDSSNDSRLTLTGIRNGFRPSTVRRQKSRITTATAQRNNHQLERKDSLGNQSFIQSHASARLKSEIDLLNNKLKRHEDSTKTLRLQTNRDLDGTPHSALSSSTSCRLSSASTTRTADRIHQRFSSAITNGTANTFATITAPNDTSNQTVQILPGIAAPLPPSPINQIDDSRQDMINSRPSHAYQIPQQSNVGSESIFLTDPPPLSSIKRRSATTDRQHSALKSVSCPYYVMYFTNLAIQQRDTKDTTNENTTTPITMAAAMRKVPVNSRTSTANARRQTNRRQLNSPISINTYSTIDDDDYVTSSTQFGNNKRLSAKAAMMENENPHMLRDILRTSSWNHIQV